MPHPPLPLVVASVNGAGDLPTAADATGLADLLEWRLDGLQDVPAAELAAAIAANPLPALITARRSDEGGFAAWPDEPDRLRTADALVQSGHWVDIEARSLEESAEWRAAAARWRARGARLVVSCHDFTGVPDAAGLARAAGLAKAAGAVVFKVAGTANTLEAVVELAAVFHLQATPAVSVMAMGKFGRASRLLFATAGSIFNYGYLRQASVPGQWPAQALLQALRDSGLR